jgi:hypothetical protein
MKRRKPTRMPLIKAFLDAMLAATPTQRLAWLEEALRLAYASGALKPREFIRGWDAVD